MCVDWYGGPFKPREERRPVMLLRKPFEGHDWWRKGLYAPHRATTKRIWMLRKCIFVFISCYRPVFMVCGHHCLSVCLFDKVVSKPLPVITPQYLHQPPCRLIYTACAPQSLVCSVLFSNSAPRLLDSLPCDMTFSNIEQLLVLPFPHSLIWLACDGQVRFV